MVFAKTTIFMAIGKAEHRIQILLSTFWEIELIFRSNLIQRLEEKTNLLHI